MPSGGVSTALVTGGAGFIGSHLVDRLLADGSRVIVVDDLSTGDTERLPGDAELEQLDIVDFEALDGVVAGARPGAVYHLAAQVSVTVSVEDPWRDCDVNVKGTLNVLQAARRVRAPVVFTSTGGALYGDGAPMPTPETFEPQPPAPYGASKLAGEAYVRSWGIADGLPHAICRLGNVYGPRQSPHGEAGVVAILSHRLWAGEPAVLYGRGDPTRDYVHVADVCDALIRAGETGGGPFNIARGEEVPVREVFDLLRAAADSDAEPVLEPLRPGEMGRSCIDPSLARERLGWSAEIDPATGVPETYRSLVEGFERST